MKIKKIFGNLVELLKPSHQVLHVEDIPSTPRKRAIYIVGQKENPWVIAFKCPCGCDANIQLNLLKETRPCWSYRLSAKNKIDLTPSVCRKYGCRSHFFIKNGKVKWC
jgi:hypothetical protein